MKNKKKTKCAYCEKKFLEDELDELLLTKEKICKKCLADLDNTNFPDDPDPLPT